MDYEEIQAKLRKMDCLPVKRMSRQTRTTTMEQCQLRLLTSARCKVFWKNLLDNLLLGSLSLVDKSLGGIYFVLDLGFEGLQASKTKNIFLPDSLYSSSSSSSASSCLPSSSPVSSSSSSPRSSKDFGAENRILMPGFNSSVSHHDIYILSQLNSPTPGDDLHQLSKPRRAGIIAERRNAKRCSEESSCTCWGWEVDEAPLDDEQFPMHDTLQDLALHEDEDGHECNYVGTSASKDVKVRWSECHCRDCRKLWMPMSKARSRLHVQHWNASNDICENQRNRNMEISPCDNYSETFNDQPSREPKLGDGNRRSFGTSASRKGDDSAGDWDRNSNLMTGAKPSRQTSARSGSTNEKKVRENTGVIFLHGIFSSSDFWFDSNIVPILDGGIKAEHMIFVPDLLGCGRSPRPHDSVYTLRDQVDALENSILRKHKLQSFHIVAHSMGTIPALAVAARFLHRVRSVTLIAPVYAGYTDPKRGGEEIFTDCNSVLSFQDLWSMRAIRSLTALEYYNINRCFGHVLFSRHRLLVPIFQRLLRNRWPRSFVRDYLAVTHDAAWHIVHNTMVGGSHALVPALRKLRDRGMRVLVIHGTDDTSCPFKQSELMREHFGNVVLAPVQGKGHVDVVLGRDDEVLPLLEEEIKLGDRNFTNSVHKFS